jgi:hypothetical protein
MAAAGAYGNGGDAVAIAAAGDYKPGRMKTDETIADTLAETSDPVGFSDVRVLAIAERARTEQSLYRAYANGRPRPGHVRVGHERPDFLFRPPYWMVIADTGS